MVTLVPGTTMRSLIRFFRQSEGQDLAEYCLIAALVALVAGAILFQVSGGMKNLWNVAGQTTNSAATSAGGAQSGATGDVNGHH